MSFASRVLACCGCLCGDGAGTSVIARLFGKDD